MTNSIRTIALKEHIHLHLIQTPKFKTQSISVYFRRPLRKEEVTKNALLSMVLPRGTKSYTNTKEIFKELENLYGAYIGCDVAKKGESQIIQFRMRLVDEQYIEEEILEKALDILNEMINSPVGSGDSFKKDYVDQEKNNLRERIEGLKNDKMQYSYEKCIQNMCQDEPYALCVYGDMDDLEKIDEKNLYEHYMNVLKTSPIDICMVGDFEEQKIQKLIENKLSFHQEKVIDVPREKIEKYPKEVQNIREKMDVSQGKLCLGYRTNIPYEDSLYHASLVYSNLLGGGAHSKLFRNVREKESLCYYIFSRIDKFKSLMMIPSGIEFENYEKAVTLIKEQVQKMNEGKFTEEDINNAKNSIITAIRGMMDNPFMLSDFYYAQAIGKSHQTLESMIEKIRKVDKEKILQSSKNMELDTIYFLTKKEEVK